MIHVPSANEIKKEINGFKRFIPASDDIKWFGELITKDINGHTGIYCGHFDLPRDTLVSTLENQVTRLNHYEGFGVYNKGLGKYYGRFDEYGLPSGFNVCKTGSVTKVGFRFDKSQSAFSDYPSITINEDQENPTLIIDLSPTKRMTVLMSQRSFTITGDTERYHFPINQFPDPGPTLLY